MTEVRPLTGTTTSSLGKAKLFEVSCRVDYLDKCFDVPVEEALSETFKDEMIKRIQVVNAAEILLWIKRECSK